MPGGEAQRGECLAWVDHSVAGDVEWLDDVRLDLQLCLDEEESQGPWAAVPVESCQAMEDRQAVPGGELGIVGLDGLESFSQFGWQMLVAVGLALPLSLVGADGPFESFGPWRRVLPGCDDGCCVEAVVQRCTHLVEELSEKDGQLCGDGSHSVEADGHGSVGQDLPGDGVWAPLQVCRPQLCKVQVVGSCAVEACGEEPDLGVGGDVWCA